MMLTELLRRFAAPSAPDAPRTLDAEAKAADLVYVVIDPLREGQWTAKLADAPC